MKHQALLGILFLFAATLSFGLTAPAHGIAPRPLVNGQESGAQPIVTWDWPADHKIEQADVIFVPFTCSYPCSVISGTVETLDGPGGAVRKVTDLVSSDFNSKDSVKYVIAVKGFVTGYFRLTVTVAVENGEASSNSLTSQIIKRQPVVVNLQPGWNLISLPERPIDPGIEKILADPETGVKTITITHIFSLQGGKWVSARFDTATGMWDAGGGLNYLQDGFAYFVYATAPTSIQFHTLAYTPVAVYPSYRLRAGWNGIGAMVGKAESVEAKTYLASLRDRWTELRGYTAGEWATIYNYDASKMSGRWSPIVDSVAHVQRGQGYFIYVIFDTVLAP